MSKEWGSHSIGSVTKKNPPKGGPASSLTGCEKSDGRTSWCISAIVKHSRIASMSGAPAAPASTTPYLDRLVPLPPVNAMYSRLKWWKVAIFLLGLTVGLFRVLCVLWMLQMLIHELGHLAGGLLVGEQFNYIRVGPFQIDHSRKISWHWTVGEVLSGGTSTLPVARSALRWRFLVSIGAGPAANIISGWFVLKFMPQQPSLLAGFCQLFVGTAFLFGFVNLLPFGDHGRMLDGLRIWVLLFSKARRGRMLSLLCMVADVKHGKDIKSLEDYSFHRWASPNDSSGEQVIANWVAYGCAKDQESAGQFLETCLAASFVTSPYFRTELIIEAAQFQALRRNRLDLAREWLAEDHSEPRFSRFWAEAVILQHDNQFDGAIAKVDEALQYVDGLLDSPSRAAMQRKLEALRLSLQEQKKSEPDPTRMDPSVHE